ncbi:3'-5' exonuclease [Aquidulcibacter sp.]|uniref:3'-5' exonuclease n=1 Tax=Aquidulcibacter sp. TaxID=2052990 RepID=UPI0025C618B9|nr:3'-5' exonuclease [Aquidulcibacter sp.]MCA3696513.1 3'-5' exoribonuclease [Aquidulcibacter sp.]
MSCTHIMIDLETEGTRAGCAIRQIGAASFNPYTGEVGRKFEMNLNTEEQYRNLNMDTDPETINWLKALPANIQEAMTRNPQPVGEVIIALIRAFDWDHPDMRLWCHGATFDEPILRELIIRFGVETELKKLVPWKYTHVRDTRTILELAGVKVQRDPSKAHTGLEDCLNQIKAVSEAYRVFERLAAREKPVSKGHSWPSYVSDSPELLTVLDEKAIR